MNKKVYKFNYHFFKLCQILYEVRINNKEHKYIHIVIFLINELYVYCQIRVELGWSYAHQIL